jgi:glycosyltransferase involved in cell wall biosynthesis
MDIPIAKKSKLRLIYVTVSMPFGSRETFFIPEAWGILRQGHELLIVPRSPLKTIINHDADGLEKHTISEPLFSLAILWTALLEFLRHPLVVLCAIGMLFRGSNPWVLLKNLAMVPKGLWLGHLARTRRADHIHAQWALTTATMAMIASRVSGIPWSFTSHRGDILDNNLLAVKLRQASFARFIAKDGIAIAESICGAPLPGHVVLLHSCVEIPEKSAFHDELSDPPQLICPAFLWERKGHKYLIEAIRILRDSGRTVNLWITNEGEMRPMLESQVAEYDLQSQITFLGCIDHNCLLGLFRDAQADLVVLPTLHEGIPAALIEPMGYGIPVISTDVGGIPELLHDGAGIMVPSKNPHALADAIERLIGDTDLRRRLSETGRRRIAEEWGVENVVTQLMQLICKNIST